MENYGMADILIVEDNSQDSELLLRALKKNNLANNIHMVEDGEQALDYIFRRGEFLSENKHDLPKVILLDLKLPRVSGLEVLKVIKQDINTRSIPVVMITTSSDEPDVRMAYELGVNSYVVKPIDFEQFIKVMNGLGFYWLMVNRPPSLIC